MKTLTTLLLVSVAAVGSITARADVKLPAIFSDHMVLQQDKTIPVWGWADPGEEVTVSIGSQSKSTKAGADGKWSVNLAKLKTGDGLTLTVKGKNSLTVSDVLVGEVWLCSGQSNMAMTVDRAQNFDQEKAGANFPKLRMFTVERNPQPKAQADCKGKWEICSAATVGRFSAAGYFFGREIHQKLGVPVGLINSSYGGTAVEAWTSMEVQARLKEYPAISESWVKLTSQPFDEAQAMARYEKQLAAWKVSSAKAKAAGKKASRQPRKPVDPRFDQNYPANLYNGMIAPIVGYAIRGGLWYQGESNANKPFANIYGLQLTTMIKDWRQRWGYDFPFAWVQLPDFHAAQKEPSEDTGWVTIREEMLRTLQLKDTGMAITLGLGMADNIHPTNKQEVGRRLSLWALADVYKQKGVAESGPLPKSHKVHGNEIVVTFTHTDGGLVSKDGDLMGFVIAGEDKQWKRAATRIEGNTVIVCSPEIAKPIAARYGWENFPTCNLFNGAGLPATPFRTDDWKSN